MIDTSSFIDRINWLRLLKRRCFFRGDRTSFDDFAIFIEDFDSWRFFPKPHQSIFIQFFFVLLNRHQTFIGLFLDRTNIRSQLRASNIFPDLFFFLQKRFVDNFIDDLSVFWIHPQIDLFMRQNDRHSMMDCRKLWSGVFCQYDNLFFRSIKGSHKKMISPDRLETKRLFFFIPFIVAFHNDYTPVLDKIEESFFIEQFLDPTVDNKIVRRFVPPFHKFHFTVFFLIELIVFCPIFCMFTQVKFGRLYCWNKCCRAYIVWTVVFVRIRRWIGFGYF